MFITRSCSLLALLILALPSLQAQTPGNIGELSLEDLTHLPVTSVGKRSQLLSDVAGSVYVIRGDDIRRSGATSLPEALRLAPNLQVARVDSMQYAITARSGADVLANKMLVLVDGRTVYSPLFSGVFWEAEDLVLDNIERIEVLSGSGGTLYGSNAFHGVINVITKPAGDTPGVMARGAAGNQERLAVARYGHAAAGSSWRVSAKRRLLDANVLSSGSAARDSGSRSHVDIRWDAGDREDYLTLEGGAARQVADDVNGYRRFERAHALARWVREGEGVRTQLQAYADRMRRDRRLTVRSEIHTLDVEAQQERAVQSHALVWGAGWRQYRDDAEPYDPAVLDLVPRQRRVSLANIFAQGDFRLAEGLRLVAGLKAERNSYSGLEWLPGLRLAWHPQAETLLWAAASRVARTPARVDVEVSAPQLRPNPAFRPERATIYELGYRGRPARNVSASATLFHHRYADLRSFEVGPAGSTFGNSWKGTLTGVEAWAELRPAPWLRLRAGVASQRPRYELAPGVTALPPQTTLGNDARHRASLSSSMEFGRGWSLDFEVRRVGARPNPAVPAYTELDARLAWQVRPSLEIAFVGNSLGHASHPEWGAPASRVLLRRSFLAQVLWRY